MLFSVHKQFAIKLRTFQDLEQMDKHIRQVLYTYHFELNQTDKAVLKAIWKHSLDVVGCSWCKVKTIAKEVNKSVRMVGYALTKLENMMIIKRHSVMRAKKGGNTSNIIQILPIPNLKELPQNTNCRPQIADRKDDSILSGSKDDQAKNDSRTKNTLNYDFNNNNVVDVSKLDSSFTSSYVDEKFTMTVKPFFNNAKMIEKFYWKFKNAVDQHNAIYEMNYSPSDLIHIGIHAFKQTIRKRNKITKDIFNYFFGACSFMLDELVVED